MKKIIALILVAGSFALPACTTVEHTAPATTTTTTSEESVVHTPVTGTSTTQVTTGAASY